MNPPVTEIRIKIRGRTISGDLNRILTLTVLLVFAVGLFFEYRYLSEYEKLYLDHDAKIIAENIAGVLTLPVWKLDLTQIESIVDRYDDFAIVQSITVTSEKNELIYAVSNQRPLTFKKKRLLSHLGQNTGAVEVGFSGELIRERNKNNFFASLLSLTLVILSLILVSTWVLKVWLQKPLLRIAGSLTRIGGGHYEERLSIPPQKDLGIISEEANQLARMIDKREKDLIFRNHTLSTLNQAIVSLYSGTEPVSLLNVSGELFQKATGADNYQILVASGLRQMFSLWKIPVPPSFLQAEIPVPADDSTIRFFPVRISGETMGGVLLRKVAGFVSEQTEICDNILSLLESALQRYFLMRSQSRHAAELTLARMIQESLLPVSLDIPVSARVHWFYSPMEQTGGDWFYFYEDPSASCLHFMMGDVTGHGLSSGMLATSVVSSLRSMMPLLCRQNEAEATAPGAVMSLIETMMSRLSPDSQLRMSCITARWSQKDNLLEICNAGHTFPLVISANRKDGNLTEALTLEQQAPLGSGSKDHRSASYQPPPGATLLLYTDGLTEAASPSGVPFSRGMFRRLNSLDPQDSPGVMLENLVRMYKVHTEKDDPSDDCCILMIRI